MATIAENLQRLVSAKNEILAALITKGAELPDDSGFEDFVEAIKKLEIATGLNYAITAKSTNGDNYTEERDLPSPVTIDLSKVVSYIKQHGSSSNKYDIDIDGVEYVIPDADYSLLNDSATGHIKLPEGLISIGVDAFNSCKGTFSPLPRSLKQIGMRAFMHCRNLAITEIPEGVTSVGLAAFYGCTSLTTLTFKGTPKSIEFSAFNDCTNLTEIRVPWQSTDSINRSAPWGAPNATVTYDYHGE